MTWVLHVAVIAYAIMILGGLLVVAGFLLIVGRHSDAAGLVVRLLGAGEASFSGGTGLAVLVIGVGVLLVPVFTPDLRAALSTSTAGPKIPATTIPNGEPHGPTPPPDTRPAVQQPDPPVKPAKDDTKTKPPAPSTAPPDSKQPSPLVAPSGPTLPPKETRALWQMGVLGCSFQYESLERIDAFIREDLQFTGSDQIASWTKHSRYPSLATRNTVFFYSEESRTAAQALATLLQKKFTLNFAVARGASEFKKPTMFVHVIGSRCLDDDEPSPVPY